MPEYVDDLTVSANALLWRRVPPWHVVVDDNAGGRLRASSAAFEDDDDGDAMSVILGTELLAGGRRAEEVLRGHQGYGLAEFTTSLARELKQGVVRDPEPEEPCHAKLFGAKTKSVRKRLAKDSAWRLDPPPRTP